MNFAVPCIAAIIHGYPCEVPRIDPVEPTHFLYGRAKDRHAQKWASHIRPITPWFVEKPPQRPDTVAVAYASPKGLGRLFRLSDGNEQMQCIWNDKRLVRAMKKVQKRFGRPLTIESAFRSRSYNNALRKRGVGAAKNSYHIRCRALDFRVRGVPIRTLARYVRSLPEIGGVGTYRNWVHMDTGRKRSW